MDGSWEAAEYIGVTEHTLRRFYRDGLLPYTKPSGGKPESKSRIRILRSDLDALIAAGLVAATQGPLAAGGGDSDVASQD